MTQQVFGYKRLGACAFALVTVVLAGSPPGRIRHGLACEACDCHLPWEESRHTWPIRTESQAPKLLFTLAMDNV